MITIGIFSKFLERREQKLNEEALDTALRATLNGVTVTEQTVLNIPAVSSTVSFLAGAISTLPVRLYRRTEEGTEEITSDYRLRLLNLETGDLLDAREWKSAMVRDYIVSGNGYTYVNWEGNRIEGLYYVEPGAVSANISPDHIFKSAIFLVDGRNIREFQMFRMLRSSVDGITGTGYTDEVRMQLETMLNSLQFENHMVRSGGKKGFLKAKNKLTQTVIDELKKSWRKLYGNSSEENVVVLNDGVEFQDAGTTAVESQLDENKKTNDHEVYKLSAIVPTVLEGGASKEDRKNTVRFAVAPVARALETAINRFCLLETEKEDGWYFELDLDALDGTDMLDRYQAYESAIKAGWMQPDEVRHQEGYNHLGMDFVLLGLNNVIFNPKTKMLYTPNTKEWTKVDKEGGNAIDEH